MALHKMCVLYDRECIGCGECDRCDLDPDKICDNCMKCVNGDAEYRGIEIDGIVLPKPEDREYSGELTSRHTPMSEDRSGYPASPGGFSPTASD